MLTARVSNAAQGRPLPLHMLVAKRQHYNHQHKIYWKPKHNSTAEQRNACVTIFDKPCLRRYFEYLGSTCPPGIRYRTLYSPVPIESKPERIWTLHCNNEPVCCFTNVTEAWLVFLAFEAYHDEDYLLVYSEL